MRRSRAAFAVATSVALSAALVAACTNGTTSPGALPTGSASSPAPRASATATPTPSATGAPPTTTSATTTSPTTTSPTTPTTPPTGSYPPVPASLQGKDLTTIPTSSKVIALTFDAGANADAVPAILATLAQEGITATFFLTGDFVTQFPGPSQQIVAAGHRLANHSVNHPDFTQLTDAQMRAEVLDAQAQILSVTGADPRPFFRFPYGARNAHTIDVVNQLGYGAIRWTVDSLGWQGTQGGTRSYTFVRDRVLNAATPGGIVLCHVGSHPTDRSTFDADALPEIIAGLRASGYSFVTLDVLLS